MRDYAELMRELSTAVAQQETARSSALRRHAAERAAAAEELRQARAAAAYAQRRRRAAHELFERVQHESAEQWQRLRVRLPGRRGSRLGVLPRQAEPSRAHVMADSAEEGASELLGEARELLDELHRRPSVPASAYPFLVFLAMICSALVLFAGRGLLLLAHRQPGPLGTVLETLGQITAFAAPLGGLPALRFYADRTGARMGAGPVVTVLLTGIATLTGLGLLVGR